MRPTPVAVLSAAIIIGLVLALMMVFGSGERPLVRAQNSRRSPELDLIWIDDIDPDGPARETFPAAAYWSPV